MRTYQAREHRSETGQKLAGSGETPGPKERNVSGKKNKEWDETRGTGGGLVSLGGGGNREGHLQGVIETTRESAFYRHGSEADFLRDATVQGDGMSRTPGPTRGCTAFDLLGGI